MRPHVVIAALATTASATSLADLCTASNIQAALPATESISGVTIDILSVSAAPVYNASVSDQVMYPDATFDYCNVSFAYSHDGLNDSVLLWYWMPSPGDFQNRYLATGGGGLSITSGNSSLPGGVMYGAVAGTTDGGFGGFSNNVGTVFLLAPGVINYESLFMFGYRAIAEATMIGKALTRNFYGMNSTRLYTYYQACSEGGREGWSQVQKFGDLYDGVVVGAPAFRYGQQQVNHLTANVVEQTLAYYPPPCELSKIVNETIAACDPLDGKTDGVVSRTDLCLLHFNLTSTIGTPYYCPATGTSSFKKRQFGTTSSEPAQNGTITAQGVAVAQTIIDGLHDSSGKRAYISYQPSSTFDDAATIYNTTTKSWQLSISSLGGEWVARFLQLQELDNLPSLNNVTYDTLKSWMIEGWQRYSDTLQTTWPDLTPFQSAGGKILHFHGESDYSIPTGSSVHYYESVRKIMYPSLSYNSGLSALGKWYRLFLVPGAGHCSANSLQPNGPFPQTNLAVMIDWVENGVFPTTLNATVTQGQYLGENRQICAWPTRPYWAGNNSAMRCEMIDDESLQTWNYTFDAYKLPLY